MAFRPMLRRRAVVPIAATLLGGATMMYPRRPLHAEAPPQDLNTKKPIYDDLTPIHPLKPSSSETSPTTSPTSPTPTDRLTVQVRRARLFFYDQSLATESAINDFMSRILHAETSFTTTIANLAPPKESGEHLLPGLVYVLVAAMAGSIISRNRNILIRGTFPVAVGVAAGWYLLPVTMRNVGDLAWEYEKRVPGVAEGHAMVGGFAREAWRQTVVNGAVAKEWAERKVGEGREGVEGWVKKGR